MTLQRGDVVLIPFPYTDFSATKTRPAVIVSSHIYHSARPELLLAYVSSQLSHINSVIDYVLTDWAAAGLLKPSFVRPKVAAIEPTLIVYRVGALTGKDLFEVDRCLRRAMCLTETALVDILNEVDFSTQPPSLIQRLAEQSTTSLVSFLSTDSEDVSLERLRNLLPD